MKRANLWLNLISFCLLVLEPGSAIANSRDNESGPSVALTRKAIALGMEPAALGELWRTKQPVVVSKTDELGQLYTTTYELSPDGQHISSKVIKEEPVLRTTTTQSPPAAVPQSTNPQTDWEYVPSGLANQRTFTLGSNWPDFSSKFPQWPSFDFPGSVTPQTSTKTSQDDQGRTVITTTKTYKGPISNSWSPGTDLSGKWPSFEFPAGVTPQTSTKTEQDDQGRTVTTTTKTYKSPVLNIWSLGAETDSLLPSGPNTFPQGLPPWSQPIPLPERPTVPSMLPPLPTPPSLGPGFTTTPKTIDTFNLDERPYSYSGNFNGAAPPKKSDMEPFLKGLLDRGGFTDEDIQNAQALGHDVVRTRVLPDGRRIKTTLRVNNSAAPRPVESVPLPTPPPSQAHPEILPIPASPPCQPKPVFRNAQGDNSIDNFLSQVQLTPADIQAQNGEVVKTIVDQHGRVLSVKFVLSTVKGDEQGQGQQEQPTK